MPRQGSKPGPGGVFFRRWGCHGYLRRYCAAGGSMDRAALRWLLLLLAFWLAPAHAVYVYVGPQWFGSGSAGAKSDTPDGTCTVAWVGNNGRVSAVAINLREVGGFAAFNCRITYSDGTVADAIDNYRGFCDRGEGRQSAGAFSCWEFKPSCPAGSSAGADGLCRSVCPSFGSQTGSSATQLTTRGDAFLLCIGDCQYAPNVSAKQSDGAWASWGPYTSMGKNCTGAEGASGTPAPATCPPAQCMGEINGTSVCKPCGEVKEPPKTTETSAPPADAGSAPAGSTPGSSSTTEQTACNGGQCTTTRTTTTVGSSGGQTSQTSTTTQPIGTYCSVNPGAAVCSGLSEGQEEEPSTWGGSCAGFQCGGDAIQCAIAREQHTRNCALFDQQTDLSRAGYTAASGDDPSDHPRKNAQVVTFGLSTMLDTTPLFGGSGGCPSDYSFVYAGHTLVIPFSQACPTLHMLGAIWMGLSYLMAATIVFYRR